MTTVLRRFRLTVPSSPLVLENDVGFSSGPGTVVSLGKSHSPALLFRLRQHGILSVMHWSPEMDVFPISVMGMIVLLA
jgi:hypothetical protein